MDLRGELRSEVVAASHFKVTNYDSRPRIDESPRKRVAGTVGATDHDCGFAFELASVDVNGAIDGAGVLVGCHSQLGRKRDEN